ncbi:MAG: GTP cyclohydrolase I FolE [Armatimonadetes bacterium]|nr:GTP cyclohydrolase I FolE [Armatimonadota bacterium]
MSEKLTDLYQQIIEDIGEDPQREGLQKTPERAAKAFQFLTQGYKQDLAHLINGAVFSTEYDDMVIVRDIEFYSLCEHHLLPFFGQAHIAYIPNGKILGLSKFARVTDMFARRLQVQERLTTEIAEAIQETLNPKGVAVVIEAKHLCMMARGVEKQNSNMVTSHVLGAFRTNSMTRAECMNLLKKGSGR